MPEALKCRSGRSAPGLESVACSGVDLVLMLPCQEMGAKSAGYRPLIALFLSRWKKDPSILGLFWGPHFLETSICRERHCFVIS